MNTNKKTTWSNLQARADQIAQQSLSALYAKNVATPQQSIIQAAELTCDFSRHFLNDAIRATLFELAEKSNLSQRIAALFAGERINTTENVAALHTVLRAKAGQVDSNLTPQLDEVNEWFEKMKQLSQAIRTGTYKSAAGEKITDIVHIGIGGSYLGSQLALEALAPYCDKNIKCHFVTTLDPAMISTVLSSLNPATTLFIMVSKSFGTEEMLVNAESAKKWLFDHYQDEAKVAMQFFAITANIEKAIDFGIKKENILLFWSWVGGRYSIWSTVGFSLMIMIGADNFRAFLDGAAAMDQHFLQTEFSQNMPVLLALVGIWYRNFFKTSSHAILPYAYQLRNLPNYLQQLEMESNGKSVSLNNDLINYKTAPVIWGGCGTESQHSFHQMLHQGMDMIPVDFIIAETSHYDQAGQQRLRAHCLAQADSLMTGKEDALAYKRLAGNKPSTIISMRQITPFTLGALLALYEHKVFAQSVIWDINCFDQWGVEYGKVVARNYLLTIG